MNIIFFICFIKFDNWYYFYSLRKDFFKIKNMNHQGQNYFKWVYFLLYFVFAFFNYYLIKFIFNYWSSSLVLFFLVGMLIFVYLFKFSFNKFSNFYLIKGLIGSTILNRFFKSILCFSLELFLLYDPPVSGF